MFLVINPEGQGLNLDAAEEISNLPPEEVGGLPRLLVTYARKDPTDQRTVYGLTLDDIVAARATGVVAITYRWVRGVRPTVPSTMPRNELLGRN